MVTITNNSIMLDNVALAASASSAPSSVQPVFNATGLMLVMSKTGNSTSMTITVYTTPDGVGMDTEAFQTFTITGAGAKQLSRPITPAAWGIFVKATNNDTVNAGNATVKLSPTYGLGR